MAANLDFYYTPVSGPCRAVMMTAKALGIELNMKLLNLLAGEHLQPEFLKINPQHTVPTLVDDGFSLWESRAIMIYLVEKYGANDALYPKSITKRALVNQRLFFDLELHSSYRNYYYPILRFKAEPNPEMYKKVESLFGFLNSFLEGQTYVAGEVLTLADISLVANVSTFEVSGLDVSKYPNVAKWYENCKKSIPGWEENWEGCLQRADYFK